MEEFLSLGLAPAVAAAMTQLGCKIPTAVQRQAIPAILASRDLIMQSETGTGKTFAYLAPILTRLISAPSAGPEPEMNSGSAAARSPRHARWPFAVIVCPTQELAVQVARQAAKLCHAAHLEATSLALLGGTHFSRQKEELKSHPALLTGTPGRLADLVRLSFFDIRNAAFIVLDEADRLFAREYRESVEFLLQHASRKAVKILASATIPAGTRSLASAWLQTPTVVDLAGEGILSEAIEHWVFYEEHRKKTALLKKILSAIRPSRCLIFASDSYRVQKVAALLQTSGHPCDTI
ncbi:MAG: DEAD/DEAH box helicase, partial [Rectinema sp.]|nr:DEAD/DEAH box helicase [Rectinema sp.]